MSVYHPKGHTMNTESKIVTGAGQLHLMEQIKSSRLEEELRDARIALWLVLKAAGPVNIPRALICKLPGDKATVTKLALSDGSVTMQAD
jgi:hypothetical protein